jgi:hypothetical protein
VRPLARFWLALERLPGQAAVAAQWKQLLQEDDYFAARFVVPDQLLATSYPRLVGDGPPFTVVHHGPEDIVGICEESSEKIRLSEQEIVIHRIDHQRLMRAIAMAFNMTADCAPMEAIPNTYWMGMYRPVAGFEFPVVLTIQIDQIDYRQVIEAILAHTSGPFLLLAPTNYFHRMISSMMLDGRKAAFIPLADAIEVDPRGHWCLTDFATQRLDEFNLKVLPSEEPCPNFFPTPAEATWSDLRLRFVDGETLRIEVCGVVQTVHYVEMGMVDRRNRKPTKQWELLRSFASGHGVLIVDNKTAKLFTQKRRENLAKDLKAFFRIHDEPIVPIKKGWKTVFVLEPDA